VKKRWRIIGSVVLAAIVAAVLGTYLFLIVRRSEPIVGAWASAARYRGTAPGDLGLVIASDGSIKVTPVPGSNVWWSDGLHKLQRRGNRIEVWQNQQVVGELVLRRLWSGRLALLDTSFPVEAAVFSRTEQDK